MTTWQRTHPTWTYKLWREQDLQDFGLRNVKLYEDLLGQGIYDGASDVARIEVLERFGGVYIDADSRCLRSMDRAPFMRAGFFAVKEIPPNGRYMVSNCFMGCVPGHPIAQRYIRHMARRKVRCSHGGQGAAFCCAWRITGPIALTGIIRGTDAMVLDPSAFYTQTIKGVPVKGKGWGEHFWSSTSERSPEGTFPGARFYEEAV